MKVSPALAHLPVFRNADHRLCVRFECAGCGTPVIRQVRYFKGHFLCWRCNASANNFEHEHGSLYSRWSAMRRRCAVKSNAAYPNYGGRGISVCAEWNTDFFKFKQWALANGYANDLTLDRIDNDGNYSPSNCHWVSRTKNNRNSRHIRFSLEKAEEIRSLFRAGVSQAELGRKYLVHRSHIGQILKNRLWSLVK